MISRKTTRCDWGTLLMVLFLSCVSLHVLSAPLEAKPILIGINQDITGFMAAEGRTHTDATLLAVEEWNAKGGINGQKIETISMNHGSDPVRATANAKTLKNKGVIAVHGGTNSTVCIAELKVFARAQIPVTGGAASSKIFLEKGPDGKPYYFSGVGADPVLARGYLDVAAAQGFKKVAILHLNVAWPRDITATMKEWVEKEYAPKYGMSIIGTVEADVGATDLSLQVHQLKQLNPDAIICAIYQKHCLALARAFTNADWHPPWVTGWSQLDAVYAKASNRAIFYNMSGPSYWDGGRPDAVKAHDAFVKKFGYVPTAHWATTYDCVNLLLTGIQEVGPEPVKIRNWMATKAYGKPLISGRKGMTAKFQEKEETWLGRKGTFYSLFDGTDYGRIWINKKGEMDWAKLN